MARKRNKQSVPQGVIDQLAARIVLAKDAAHRVGQFLNNIGFKNQEETPLLLSEGFLIRLGMALVLQGWEQQGHQFHREIGLPVARDLIVQTLRTWNEPIDSTTILNQVTNLFIKNLWWDYREMGPIAIRGSCNYRALRAFAELLWANRHRSL